MNHINRFWFGGHRVLLQGRDMSRFSDKYIQACLARLVGGVQKSPLKPVSIQES